MNKNCFARRSVSLELMDTEPFSFDQFQSYLHDLERVNAWTLAYRPTLRWLKRAMAGVTHRHFVTILDAGSGNGDMLRRIEKWARRQGFGLELTGVDLNPWAKKSAERAVAPCSRIHFETVNVFDLDPSRRFDFIISSLFTHHLTDEEIVRFLRWMDEHALRGWLINDLHRHPLPYFFAKYAARFSGINSSIQNDAPISVARAFTAADWRRFLDEAGIPAEPTEISWFFPFRYCVARRQI